MKKIVIENNDNLNVNKVRELMSIIKRNINLLPINTDPDLKNNIMNTVDALGKLSVSDIATKFNPQQTALDIKKQLDKSSAKEQLKSGDNLKVPEGFEEEGAAKKTSTVASADADKTNKVKTVASTKEKKDQKDLLNTAKELNKVKDLEQGVKKESKEYKIKEMTSAAGGSVQGGIKITEDDSLNSSKENEYEMAKSQLISTQKNIEDILKYIQGSGTLEDWVQSAITTAQNEISNVLNRMRGHNEPIEERIFRKKIKESITELYTSNKKQFIKQYRQILSEQNEKDPQVKYAQYKKDVDLNEDELTGFIRAAMAYDKNMQGKIKQSLNELQNFNDNEIFRKKIISYISAYCEQLEKSKQTNRPAQEVPAGEPKSTGEAIFLGLTPDIKRIIETDYQTLISSKDQRDSYKQHLIDIVQGEMNLIPLPKKQNNMTGQENKIQSKNDQTQNAMSTDTDIFGGL